MITQHPLLVSGGARRFVEKVCCILRNKQASKQTDAHARKRKQASKKQDCCPDLRKFIIQEHVACQQFRSALLFLRILWNWIRRWLRLHWIVRRHIQDLTKSSKRKEDEWQQNHTRPYCKHTKGKQSASDKQEEKDEDQMKQMQTKMTTKQKTALGARNQEQMIIAIKHSMHAVSR